ncbi:MAG: response regulator [Elusimicrobia bacterium]|nr:response regulator [Elusimicrobiota bacterium]
MRSQSVLIVDDDLAGRAMLRISLKQAGFDVDSAGSAEEALRRLQERRYDWLLTDAKMEPMDGFELSRRAKTLYPGMRIIMTSALYNDRDILVAPIDRFVPKPIRFDSLLNAMRA